MPPESIFLLVSTAVAVLLGAGAVVAALRARSDQTAIQAAAGDLGDQGQADKYEVDRAGLERRGRGSYGTAVRVLWWVSIASVLIGVGLSDAYDDTQAAIYALGAIAVVAAVVLHDLLPDRLRTQAVVALEVVLAIALTTVLLVLTDYASSPFVFVYLLIAVAVALALGGPIALVVAMATTFAFLGVLALDPQLVTYTTSDLLRFGLQLGTIWLLAYVAGVFASGERRMRNSVLQLSRTDELTGLYNRSQLFPTLEEEVQRTRRSERGFCLLMIDLDGLKAVNDSFGHHRGDEVLRLLGGVIRHSIRLVDTAYRYGGDEFLVLLPETDFAGAFVVAEKIRVGAEEVGLAAGGGELLTSVSIGLVSCPEDGSSAEELMIAADRAMYQAKSLGKNQVSGNPRPRRLTLATQPSYTEQAVTPMLAAPKQVQPPPVQPPPVQPPPVEPPPVIEVPPAAAEQPTAAAAIAVEPEQDPVPVMTAGEPAHETLEDDEATPSEVRRNIATARRNLDPDHQIRRAMDAFLSPSRPNDNGTN
ncbi:MAG TPA: GGDEF domain-containing protein [Candidatus Limnocylindria bacterium]|nr:GGDEF domain-containing protein [Candidatus Limnocylindria bacterium]